MSILPVQRKKDHVKKTVKNEMKVKTRALQMFSKSKVKVIETNMHKFAVMRSLNAIA